MTDSETPTHRHTIRERLDAAEAAADEVVADESGQLSGEVNALLLPLEQAAAALRAAINPDRLVEEGETHDPAPADAPAPAGEDTDQG
jgi:hypothetical protein